MSATYNRQLRAKEYLESRFGLECFVPLQYKIMTRRGGRKVRELMPAVQNLFFVRATKDAIQQAKGGLDYVQYLTRPEGSGRRPLTVPDGQMASFMAVANTWLDTLIYLRPDEVNLRPGSRVKIIGGQFDGLTGNFVRVKGARSRRLVIILDGVTAIAAEITPDLIQPLE